MGVLITERIKLVPLVHGDPSTAVADGAARMAWQALAHGVPLGASATPAPALHASTPPPRVNPPPPPRVTLPPRVTSPPIRTPPPAVVMPRRKRKRWAWLTVVVVALLVVGGFAVYIQSKSQATNASNYVPRSVTCSDGSVVSYSYECPTPAAADPTTPPVAGRVSSPATIVGVSNAAVRVWSTPSLTGTILGALPTGTTVQILCTTLGEGVRRTDNGQASNLWDRISQGYVPDIFAYTGTNAATMPQCS